MKKNCNLMKKKTNVSCKTKLYSVEIFKNFEGKMERIAVPRNKKVDKSTEVSKLPSARIKTDFGVSLINSICLSFQANKTLHFTFQNSTTIPPLFEYKNKADPQVPFNVFYNTTIRSEWHANNEAAMIMHFNDTMDFTKRTIKLVIQCVQIFNFKIFWIVLWPESFGLIMMGIYEKSSVLTENYFENDRIEVVVDTVLNAL